MTGYKQIIKNMVEMEVARYVEKKSGKFSEVTNINLSTEEKYLGKPTFEVEITVDIGSILRRDYLVNGYIGDYGSVDITSVCFTRTVKKYGEKKFKTVNSFIAFDELNDFTFDR